MQEQHRPLTAREVTWLKLYIRDHWISEDMIRDAMESVATALTADIGGDWPPDDAPGIAGRQPVSLAAAFEDLCRALYIEPPPFVFDANDGTAA